MVYRRFLLAMIWGISGSIHHMIGIFGAHVENDDISRCFVYFFKILIFLVGRGVKLQEMAQNDKKFCLSHSVSQELYLIWLWFLVHLCKMMIFPAIFFIFLKFWFLGFLGVRRIKGQKMTHSYQFQSVTLYMWRTVDHITKIVDTQV